MPVDPNALATWANAITVGRLLLSPLMFLVIPADTAGSWLAFGLWFALSVSDGVDGWIARRHGTTRSGAFLDPLADKVLILGAIYLLASVLTETVTNNAVAVVLTPIGIQLCGPWHSEETLLAAVARCAARGWDEAEIRRNAERFSEQAFIDGIARSIAELLRD